MASQPGARAVVVGASMAGLFAARALADHADEVVVLERETLSGTGEPGPRGHVPQGRHLHLLLAAGLDRLEAWFPGIDAELESRGAVRVDGSRGWVHQGGAYRAQGDWGRWVLCMTRPLVEAVVRARVEALANVTIRSGTTVERVLLDGGRVRGVVTKGGRVSGSEVGADLVVDASGRASRIAHDLAEQGLLVPPVSTVRIDIGYASCFLPRSPVDLDGTFVVCQDPVRLCGGAVLPVEGDRWQVTLSGVHGDVPPGDEAGFLEFARGLPVPLVAQLVEHCGFDGPINTYRFPSSQRRHFERAALLPGLVMVGDASSSFDPVYGQGMTSAALQAEALGEAVRRSGIRADDLPKRFHRKAARVINTPWQIAVGGDFAHPLTTGPRPAGAAGVNAYVRQVVRASHTSVDVARAFNRVIQLVEPPTTLARPGTVLRVARAARRSPVRHPGAEQRHPRVGPGVDTGSPGAG